MQTYCALLKGGVFSSVWDISRVGNDQAKDWIIGIVGGVLIDLHTKNAPTTQFLRQPGKRSRNTPTIS